MTPPVLLVALLFAAAAPSTRDPQLGIDWKKFLQPGCSAHGTARLGKHVFFSVSCGREGERLNGLYRVPAGGGPPERILECDGAIDLTVAGGTLYYLRHQPETGYELWASDGTREGNRLVKDIFPGRESSNPAHLSAVGTRLVFQANDGVHGRELWASDGTAKGTTLLKDLLPGADEGQPTLHPGAGGLVYFSAIAGPKRTGWWKTDGTAEGTVLLLEQAEKLKYEEGDEKYWSAGFRMWQDAARHTFLMHKGLPPSSWRKVKDLGVVERTTGVTASGERTYFALHQGVETTLWVSDGTAEGTRTLATMGCGPGCRAPGMTGFSGCGHDLFVLDNPFHEGATAWASDGTPQGTHPIVSGLHANLYGCVGSTSFVWVQRQGPGVRTALYATDGTVAGTWLVWELEPPKQQPQQQ
jgi:ELWxxDGT repeat protein